MDMRMKIQYINEKNQGRGVIMAVSYTHLDVYKRQGVRSTTQRKGTGVSVSGALVSGRRIKPRRGGPVSYTHLEKEKVH